MFLAGSSPVLTHCVFHGNRARQGGAVFSTGVSSPIINNTIFSHTSVISRCSGALDFRNGTTGELNWVVVEYTDSKHDVFHDTDATEFCIEEPELRDVDSLCRVLLLPCCCTYCAASVFECHRHFLSLFFSLSVSLSRERDKKTYLWLSC
mmetsp:Transcript_1870/g.2455  ORF Transcript_1870/g.2455 Transcript_1870/m.2455 type:complete len:150 (-) Transcript_1870:445-894(-)